MRDTTYWIALAALFVVVVALAAALEGRLSGGSPMQARERKTEV